MLGYKVKVENKAGRWVMRMFSFLLLLCLQIYYITPRGTGVMLHPKKDMSIFENCLMIKRGLTLIGMVTSIVRSQLMNSPSSLSGSPPTEWRKPMTVSRLVSSSHTSLM